VGAKYSLKFLIAARPVPSPTSTNEPGVTLRPAPTP
jgi:hypothetical protein